MSASAPIRCPPNSLANASAAASTEKSTRNTLGLRCSDAWKAEGRTALDRPLNRHRNVPFSPRRCESEHCDNFLQPPRHNLLSCGWDQFILDSCLRTTDRVKD